MWFRRRKANVPVPAPEQAGEETLQEGTLLSHLIELRTRLMRAALAVLIVFLILLPFTRQLFTFVALPVLEIQTGNEMAGTMQAIDLISSFFTPLKLALYTAFFIAMPVVLYQAWAFIAPGLYRREKRLVVPLMASSILLFYLGMAFAYYVVFPIIFRFLIGFFDLIPVNPDIALYLNLVLKLFFAFGLAFEVPIVVVLLVRTGFTTVEKLGSQRAYVFLGCFVVGMLLTPPDVISQTLLAIPMYLLYELGMIMARYLGVAPPESVDENEAGKEAG